jgi:hypothetical protein
LSTIALSFGALTPFGIAATPSGALIVSCTKTHSVYAIDPYTGHCERVAGTGSSGEPKDGPALQAVFEETQALVAVDSECSAYVSDLAIRRITLPPEFFLTRMIPALLFSLFYHSCLYHVFCVAVLLQLNS